MAQMASEKFLEKTNRFDDESPFSGEKECDFWGGSGTSPVCKHAHVAEYSEASDASFAVATERPGVPPSTVSLSQSACSRGLIRHTFEGADRSVVNIVVMYMEDVSKLCFYTCIDSMAIDFDLVVFVPSPCEVGN